MNKKGFTLVELLAVILILSSISLIAVMGISASLDNRDKKQCQIEKDIIKNAAKVYFSLNNVNRVDIATLKSGGYITSNSNITKLSDSDYVTFSSGDDIVVVVSGECHDL